MHVEPDEVGSEVGKPARIFLCPPWFEDDVLALHIAQFSETAFEALPPPETARVWCAVVQKTDPGDLPRLLPLGGERRGEEAASQSPEERAPVHHSMTWSARCRSDGGIVRPRALAVLRLMTNSNFIGCSTGRSTGFAPFKILSMYRATWRNMSSRFTP